MSLFITVNQDVMTELIRKSERRVCYAAPGVYDWVAEALIEVSKDIGQENVLVIVDPNPFIMQVGYGTEQSLQRLHEEHIPVRVQPGLRIGIVIADEVALVFAPPALNVDVFPNAGVPNAIRLSSGEAARLLDAVAEGDEKECDQSDNVSAAVTYGLESVCPSVGAIGTTMLLESDMAAIHETLVQHPPVSPDLDRQMRVINSMFQVVKITLSGAKLSQRRLPLRAEELGIEDAKIAHRIGANFKLFEAGTDYLTKDLQNDLENIKRTFNLKPMGEVGHLVLARDRAKLEQALTSFQGKLESAQKELKEEIEEELKNSRERLKQLFASKLRRPGEEEARFNRRIDSILHRMKFPRAEDVLSDLKCTWYIFNISEQMIDEEEFAEKVKALYGKPIEDLIKIERAVGVKPEQTRAANAG